MTKYLAGVLSVIAVGVLLVAYGLLAPRTAAFSADPYRTMTGAMPVAAGMQTPYPYGAVAPYPNAYAPNGWVPAQYPTQPYGPGYVAQQVGYAPVPAMQVVEQAPQARAVTRTYRPASTRRASVERGSGRTWKKSALVIGGSSAAGAGIGGLIGGKKGALIGAAVGGGGATLFEARKH